MTRWHCWRDEEPRPGWANMAIDLVLLEEAERGEGWLRLYTWEPHCLSFGRNEPASTRYNRERIRELALDTVRRPTGGRAVWHSHELTYAVAVPCHLFGSLQAAYRDIHQLLADALGAAGIAATLAARGRPGPLDGGACFSRPVGGEVLVAGRKRVGSAQLRQGTGLLQHGSILLQDDQYLLGGLLQGQRSPAEPASPRAPPLTDATGQPVSAEAMAAGIGTLAPRRWPGDWDGQTEPGTILERAARHFPRFQSAGWTWAR